jgi:hypothetical protein
MYFYMCFASYIFTCIHTNFCVCFALLWTEKAWAVNIVYSANDMYVDSQNLLIHLNIGEYYVSIDVGCAAACITSQI